MNLLMIYVTIWRWRTSLTQMMIVKPTKISNNNVLRTIKTHTITACWLECQQTTGCETIATDPDNEKIYDLAFECYILGSDENKPESSNETPLKATELIPFTVSYFELVYSIICDYFFIISCSLIVVIWFTCFLCVFPEVDFLKQLVIHSTMEI